MKPYISDEEARIRAWEELRRGEHVGDIPELAVVLRLLDQARARIAELESERDVRGWHAG